MEDYQALILDADEKIACNPRYAGAYRQRAYLKMEHCDYDGAIEDFTVAISMKKKHAITWFYRGLCFYYLENNLCALNDYTNALKYKPRMSDAWCEIGRVMFMMDDHPRAEEHCTKALSINPRNCNALTLRGNVRLLLKQPDKALKDLNRAFKIKPFDSMIRIYRAMAYQTLGRNAEALEDYGISIALAPDATAYYNRCLIFIDQDQYKEALADARKALELAPDWDFCQEIIDEIADEMGW